MNYPDTFISYYKQLNLKLTSLRREILYILWCEKKSIKAYEILECLLKTKINATPPNVYRSLDFFVANNVLHKIESIQSYTLCCEPIKQLPVEILMVCHICHSVIETHDSNTHLLLSKLAKQKNFKLTENPIELKGTCEKCIF